MTDIPLDIDVARALRCAGWSYQRIGDYFSVSRQRIETLVDDIILDTRAVRAQQQASSFDADYRQSILDGAQQGLSIAAIARQNGLNTRQVSRALPRYLTAEQLTARRRRVNRRRSIPARYQREQLLELLREAADGQPALSVTRYSAWRERSGRGPTPAVFHQRFGSWRQAVQAAGLQCGSRPERFGRPRYSEEQVREALTRITAQLGHPPSSSEYERHCQPGEPVMGTLRVRYGGWTAALEAHGLLDDSQPLAA